MFLTIVPYSYFKYFFEIRRKKMLKNYRKLKDVEKRYKKNRIIKTLIKIRIIKVIKIENKYLKTTSP